MRRWLWGVVLLLLATPCFAPEWLSPSMLDAKLRAITSGNNPPALADSARKSHRTWWIMRTSTDSIQFIQILQSGRRDTFTVLKGDSVFVTWLTSGGRVDSSKYLLHNSQVKYFPGDSFLLASRRDTFKVIKGDTVIADYFSGGSTSSSRADSLGSLASLMRLYFLASGFGVVDSNGARKDTIPRLKQSNNWRVVQNFRYGSVDEPTAFDIYNEPMLSPQGPYIYKHKDKSGSRTWSGIRSIDWGTAGAVTIYANDDNGLKPIATFSAFAGNRAVGINIANDDVLPDSALTVFGGGRFTGGLLAGNLRVTGKATFETRDSGKVRVVVDTLIAPYWYDAVSKMSIVPLASGWFGVDSARARVDSVARLGKANTFKNQQIINGGLGLKGVVTAANYYRILPATDHLKMDLGYWVSGAWYTGSPAITINYTGQVGIGAVPDSVFTAGNAHFTSNIFANNRIIAGTLTPTWVNGYLGSGLATSSGTVGRAYIQGSSQAEFLLDNSGGGTDVKILQFLNQQDSFKIRKINDPATVATNLFTISNETKAATYYGNLSSPTATFATRDSGKVAKRDTIFSKWDSISSRLAAVRLVTHTSGASGKRDTMGTAVLDTLYYLVLTARCPFNIQIPETTAGEWAGFVKKGNKTIARMDMEGNWYNAKGERQNGTAPPKKEYPLWLIGAGLGAVAIVISWRKRR